MAAKRGTKLRLALSLLVGAARIAPAGLLLATAPAQARDAQPAKPLNIVFIEADDLTQKYVGAFGSRTVRTPAIDALARQGVIFPNAVAQGTMCAPSRNSLITGLYPRNLGFYANGTVKQLPTGIWAFPQALQKQGYHTTYLGKSHMRPPLAGIDRKAEYRSNQALMKNLGFDEASSSLGRVVVMKNARKMKQGWRHGEDAYADYLYDKGLVPQFVADAGKISTLAPDDYLDGNIAKRATDWIGGYQGKDPFFLWINFSAPHGPYDAPGKWVGSYKPSDAPAVIVDKDKSDIPSLMQTIPWTKGEAKARSERAEYAGMVSYMDSQVARILAALDARGLRDNTMIVFFSDQGVMDGDHGLQHKYTLYDEVILPSLVVAMPGAKQGARVDRPVELLDLVPTVLDLAGAPAKVRGPAKGYSLLPLLKGTGDIPRTAAYAELYNAAAMVTPEWKYIETTEGNVLFDRRKDPQELTNVVQANPAIAARLAAEMQRWRDGQGGPAKPLDPEAIAKILEGGAD